MANVTNAQLIEDFQLQIAADVRNLAEALQSGDRAEAHGLVDSIVDTARELEDTELIARSFRALDVK